MDEVLELYVKSKRIGLFEEAVLDELRYFSRNWKKLCGPSEAELAPEEDEDEEEEDAEIQEQELKKAEELDEMLAKAEEVLAKSQLIISGQFQQSKESTDKSDRPAPSKASAKTGSSFAKPETTKNIRGKTTTTTATNGTSRALRTSVSQSSLGHKPVYMSAPYKTQPTNLLGNKRPQFPVVQRPAAPRLPAKSSSTQPPNVLVRSNSASSVRQSAAAMGSIQKPVHERNSLGSQNEHQSAAAATASRAMEDLRIGRVSDGGADAALVSKRPPSFGAEALNKRENQMAVVKNVQNALKEHLELKRRVLVASRKPSNGRAGFLAKLAAAESEPELRVDVHSSGVFKVHQASVVYQRLGCLVRREMLANGAPSTETGVAEKHQTDKLLFQRLSNLKEKMAKIDRLIMSNLDAVDGPNLFSAECDPATTSAFIRKHFMFPMLTRKLGEIYFEKTRELDVYAELKCQKMELDHSLSLLNLIKSTWLPILNELHAADSKDEAFVRLLSSIVYFVSSDSKRTVFIDEN